MFRNARTIFLRARAPIALYAAGLAAYGYGAAAMRTLFAKEEPNYSNILLDVIVSIGNSAVIAALMAIGFSRVARLVEGRMWRIETDAEALRRFFGMFFLLVLCGALVLRLTDLVTQAIGEDSATVAMFLLYLFATSLIVPLGTLVLFHGVANRESIREGTQILEHQFPSVMVVILLNVMLLFVEQIVGQSILLSIQQTFGEDFVLWTAPLLAILSALRVFYIFSCAWAICVYHRDEYEADNDFDI
jgi:hypothetical protein